MAVLQVKLVILVRINGSAIMIQFWRAALANNPEPFIGETLYFALPQHVTELKIQWDDIYDLPDLQPVMHGADLVIEQQVMLKVYQRIQRILEYTM